MTAFFLRSALLLVLVSVCLGSSSYDRNSEGSFYPEQQQPSSSYGQNPQPFGESGQNEIRKSSRSQTRSARRSERRQARLGGVSGSFAFDILDELKRQLNDLGSAVQNLETSQNEIDRTVGEVKSSQAEQISRLSAVSQSVVRLESQSRQMDGQASRINSAVESVQNLDGRLQQALRSADSKAASLNEKVESLEQELRQLEGRRGGEAVPIGFVYVQLPGQKEPGQIWSEYQFQEISERYEGQFFRVVGGASAPFGQVQESNVPRIEQVQTEQRSLVWGGKHQRSIQLSDGATSEAIYTGSANVLHNPENFGLKFRTSGGEVRPVNQAVRVWERIA